MNDAELDRMLADWKTPAAPDELRADTRARYLALQAEARPHNRWTEWFRASGPRVFAGAFLSVVAVLFVVAKALPQTLDLTGVPYTVDSEIVNYRDGTLVRALQLTSFNRDGSEVVLAKSIPDSMIGTLFLHAVESFHGMLRVAPPLHQMTPAEPNMPGGMAKVVTGCDGPDCVIVHSRGWGQGSELLKAGCVYEGALVGRETILDYPTVAIQRNWRSMRTTLWMAPALGCFALRIETAYVLSDGKTQLVSEKHALRVTLHEQPNK